MSCSIEKLFCLKKLDKIGSGAFFSFLVSFPFSPSGAQFSPFFLFLPFVFKNCVNGFCHFFCFSIFLLGSFGNTCDFGCKWIKWFVLPSKWTICHRKFISFLSAFCAKNPQRKKYISNVNKNLRSAIASAQMVYVHRINFNHFHAIALFVVLLNVYITTSAIDILFSNSSKAFRWKSAVMLLKTKTLYSCDALQLERISPSCQVWFTISLNPTNTFLEMKKRSSCFFLLLQMLHFILKSFLDKNAVFFDVVE